MNIATKIFDGTGGRFRGRALAALLLTGVVASAEEAPFWQAGTLRFYTIADAQPTPALTVDEARGLKSNLPLLREWNGVVSTVTARKTAESSGKTMHIEFSGVGDGRNLTIRVENFSMSPMLYDWVLMPLVEFVDSGDAGLMTVSRSGGDGRQSEWFHPAIQDTLLGARLWQAYHMITNPLDFGATPLLRLDIPKPLPYAGPGEGDGVRPAANHVAIYRADTRHWSVWEGLLVSDLETDIFVGVDRGALQLMGKPDVFFWTSADHGGVEPAVERSRLVEDHWGSLRRVNVQPVNAVEQVLRWAAVFRLARDEDPEGWARFVEDAREARTLESVPIVPSPAGVQRMPSP